MLSLRRFISFCFMGQERFSNVQKLYAQRTVYTVLVFSTDGMPSEQVYPVLVSYPDAIVNVRVRMWYQ